MGKYMLKKGFSLLELTLVLGVGTMVAFMKFQDMKNEQESVLASAVGQQMKQMGEAVNSYISIRYDKLATLSNAAGNGTDPGPRTCTTSGCEITYQTLINEGLLPVAHTGINAKKSPYKILLKRNGASPNYVINGLIITSIAWIEGGKTRYDLLGQAMYTAGIDSGVTKTATSASGYGGQWTENSSDFNNITTAGQLSFRVGYNSALYSIYLRRDGTLPMTGNLNMDGNNINNVKNLTATGDLTTTGNISGKDINATGVIKSVGDITSGGWLKATTGFGDQMMIGGDSAGRDYEIKLKTKGLPLVIHDDYNSTDYTILQTYGSFQALGDIRASKTNTSSGNITAAGQISAHNGYGDQIILGGDAAGEDYELKMTNPSRPLTIWYSGSPAMSEIKDRSILMLRGALTSGSIKSFGDINVEQTITASGNIKGSTLESTGRSTVGEFIQLNGQATAGATCLSNGLQGRTPEGQLLSCTNGVWRSSGGKPNKTFYTYTNYNNSYNYSYLGKHDVCVSIYGNENDQDDTWRGVEQYATDQWRITVKNSSETALCLDW